MPSSRIARFLSIFTVSGMAAAAGHESSLSDGARLFLDELPVVLSMSRLAQPLGDAPGSVTVIDADLIRSSGARDLGDLLRMVPGFLVAQSTGGAPMAVYHGLTDEHPRGLQILVDGRSQYSPLYYGGVSWNLIDVSLDDIERIEVVRGSNSAAYGSNAFLGVVNIVTRSAALTQGVGVRIAQGGDGIADRYARIGARVGNGFARLSAERSHDHGVMHRNDNRRSDRVNLRLDLPLAGSHELQFQAGLVDVALDAGEPDDTRDAPRVIDSSKDFVSAAWLHNAADGGGVSLRYTRSQENYSDVYVASDPSLDRLAARLGLPSPYPVPVNQRIRTTRDDLEFQHTLVAGRDTRLVWGIGSRSDRVRGEQFYSTRSTLHQDVHRLFGNLEWRPQRWVFNAGATWERDSLSHASLAPRLSANFHPTPEHTIRAAVTRAHRLPTLTESRARSAYGSFDTGLLGRNAGVVPVEITRKTSGGLEPERIDVQEIGYLGDLRALRLFVDVRAFREEVHERIVPVTLALAPPDCELLGIFRNRCGRATDFLNGQDLRMTGLEYQLRWRPRAATELTFNQAFIDIESRANKRFAGRDPEAARLVDRHMERSAPHAATMLRWSERLPLGLEGSVTHYRYARFQWTPDSSVGPFRRTDVRLAYPLRLGAGTDGELAVVVQGLGGRHAEYQARAVGTEPVQAEYLRPRGWVSLTLRM